MDCVFFRHLDSAGRFFSPDSHSPGFRPGTVAVEDRSASAQNGTQRSAAYKQLFFCSGLGTLTPPESVRVPFWHVFLSFPLSFSTSTLACWHPYCRLHVFCFRHGRRAPPPYSPVFGRFIPHFSSLLGSAFERLGHSVVFASRSRGLFAQ